MSRKGRKGRRQINGSFVPTDIYNLLAGNPAMAIGETQSSAAEELAAAMEIDLYDVGLLMQPGPKELPFIRGVTMCALLTPGWEPGLRAAQAVPASHADCGVSAIGGLFNCSAQKATESALAMDDMLLPAVATIGSSLYGATPMTTTPFVNAPSVNQEYQGDVLLQPTISLVIGAWQLHALAQAVADGVCFMFEASVEVEWMHVSDKQAETALVASLLGESR